MRRSSDLLDDPKLLTRSLENIVREHRHLASIPPDQPVQGVFRQLFVQWGQTGSAVTPSNFEKAMSIIEVRHPWVKSFSVHILDLEANPIYETIRNAFTYGP